MIKIFLLGLVWILLSCAQQTFHSGLTASTKVSSVEDYKILGKVEESACNRMVFFFYFSADYKRMYKKVFEDAQALGGDAMIDFQVRSKKFFYLPYPFGYISDCWEATGTAVKLRSGSGFEGASSKWDLPPDSVKSIESKPTKSKWDSAPQ